MSPFARSLFLAPLAAALIACTGAGAADQTPVVSSEISLSLEHVTDAEQPWGMTFLADGGLLFTEKEGGLKYLAPGASAAAGVSGLPQAFTANQAGYLGIALDPAFETNRLVYVAYSAGTQDDNTTAVVRGALNDARDALENVEEIFRADPRNTAFHYGARLVFAPDGTLFVGLGEGFRLMQESQNPANTHGTIVRINADGSIPADNPFADGENGHPAVWSYGHRNIQGMVYDPSTDTLWATEHGPKGGDELNIIRRGANYGWPAITYGVNYDGSIITTATEAPGMEQPEVFWVPSIAPAGLTILASDKYPGWEGSLFSGGMNGPAGLVLVRIEVENGRVTGKEDLLKGEMPIRDVVQGPDGYLYVAHKDFDGIFRVVPEL
ncbi:PQQ-dependent sugar dehydrogenase [Hyphomonas sp.]|uniref:PQQ-dependent sugar dehydrogenase n=1 Tax=Hyphomonas sp. TaxID=87 RepID=UPI00391D664A